MPQSQGFSSVTAILLGVVAASFSTASAQPAPGSMPFDESFVRWSAQSLQPISSPGRDASSSDLEPLAEMIGDARIVALGEGVHAGAEPLVFRNRLFRYLVEELGFTAIAIESGITESRVVHDYVLGGPGELQEVMAQGFSWTFDRFPQNEALVRWMREYNQDPRHVQKIRFFGFDVPGSPGNGMAARGARTSLDEALAYLDRVDPRAAIGIRARLVPLLSSLGFDYFLDSGTAPPDTQYLSLSQAERDLLTAAIADLVSFIERRQLAYRAETSTDDYEWAYRAAIGARQTDAQMRRIPSGWTPDDGMAAPLEAQQVRDRAMADNMRWIIERAGEDARLFVFGSRTHLFAAPSTRSTFGTEAEHVPLGVYLRQQHGDDMLVIGNLVGEGETGCKDVPTFRIEFGSESSVDAQLAGLGVPHFILDLRAAPADVAAWLGNRRLLGNRANGNPRSRRRVRRIVFFEPDHARLRAGLNCREDRPISTLSHRRADPGRRPDQSISGGMIWPLLIRHCSHAYPVKLLRFAIARRRDTKRGYARTRRSFSAANPMPT